MVKGQHFLRWLRHFGLGSVYMSPVSETSQLPLVLRANSFAMRINITFICVEASWLASRHLACEKRDHS